MKQKTGRKLLGVLLTLVMVIGLMPGMSLTALAADEVSENISLVNGQSLVLGTHYSVSGEFGNESGIHVYNKGPMTINARKGETITKVVLTYSWGNYKSSLSASPGTFDGNATISDINAQQVTISSSDTRGVKISAVTVYFEGSLSNPTVTLTGGANAKSSGGLLTQSYLPGAMDTVTYTALTGATFPAFETFTQNGVTVERTSDTVVTISGTPTANTEITVPDAESSSKIVTWGSSIIKDSGKNGLAYQIRRNNSYSDTANGITLTKSGDGTVGSDDWYSFGSLELNFTTATGKFTSIEIETSQIYDGGNWTKDGNTLKWNGTPSNSVSLSGSGLYLEGVSSINFVIEMPTVSVTITAGDHMTKTTGSGDAEQTGLTGAMTDVVYTADNGYYYPTDYSVAEVSGIKVTRNSYTQITVSGTPTANAAITLTAPTAKTTPDAPTTAAAVNCTTADNNDGKLTGVTAKMEYKKSDATDWTAGTGSDITGLAPGTYYVRIKATDTTNASGNQELTITDYLSVTKTAAKADLDTLLGTKTESDYDAADWTTLTQAIANGKTAIENATTTDAVATAKNTAVDAVNAVKTKAQKLADAKTTAKNDLDTLLGTKTESDYDAADWTTLTQAIANGKTAIDNATTIDDVATAKSNAETAANTVKTKAEKLADAKTAAKADLDTLLGEKTEADYDAADWTTLTQAITDGKTAIENATTTDAVATAKNTAVDAVNAVKTKAQKLADAKTTAKNDLDTLLGTKTESDYDAADWTTLTQAITDGKTAIENATTTDAVATAKNNAVDAVNAVKTKAQKALENAKTSAVNTVNAVNANDYIAADQQTVTDAKTTALAAIEAATTEEEVTTALNNFNNAIASCTTQVVADQIAQVMSEVSAKTGSDMTYTGSPIQLINTPTTALPAGYTMKYAVTTENVKPTDESLYTTSIPSKTDVGTYYVWYKAVGDEDHSDSKPACITVTISKPAEAPAPADEEKGEADFKPSAAAPDVKGVEQEAIKSQMEELAKADDTKLKAGQVKDVTVSMETKAVAEKNVPKKEASAIKETAEGMIPAKDRESTKCDFLDIAVSKIVSVYDVKNGKKVKNESDSISAGLTNLAQVIDIPVKYDLTGKFNPLIVRYHNGKAEAFRRLYAAPDKDALKDGTYYVEGTGKNAIVHIYTNRFSTYALLTSGTEEYPKLGDSVTVYRLYYGPTMEHFYTTSAYERRVLIDKYGWVDEGIAWKSPKAPTTDEEKKTIKPVYRLFNPFTTDHHYTKDANERKTLINKYGWKDEGIAFYCNDKGDATVYRLWHPGLITGAHHFTTGKHEYDVLITRGWIGETEAFKVNAAS